MTDAIGWLSALILLATLVTQVGSQWRERSDKGISPWLFVGQLSASIGFIVHSALTDNIVFIVTNSLIALVAITGEIIYLRNKRSKARSGS
jgi:MtN3 and saliva related transmembrane protein